MMNARPIIFSTEMVKAITEGRKTQTRRVMKHQPVFTDGEWRFAGAGWNRDDVALVLPGHSMANRCPYGQIGERLWVRETWAHDDPNCKDVRCGNRDHIWWKANESEIVADSFAGDARWRSSRFIPRWASRITLEVVEVGVERLRRISYQDIRAEGVYVKYGSSSTYTAAFMFLWDSINGKRGHSWADNPWVWVVEFKVVER